MSTQRNFSKMALYLFGTTYSPGLLGDPQHCRDFDVKEQDSGLSKITLERALYSRTLRLLTWRGQMYSQNMSAEVIRSHENNATWVYGKPLPPVTADNMYGVPDVFYDDADFEQAKDYLAILRTDMIENLIQSGLPEDHKYDRLVQHLFENNPHFIEEALSEHANALPDALSRLETHYQSMDRLHAFWDMDQNFVDMGFLKDVILDLKASFDAAAQRGGEYPSMHMALVGGPGAGKSKSATFIAQSLQRLGMLKSDHVVRISLGEIASTTHNGIEEALNAAFERASDGVLLFDEVDTVAGHMHRGQKRSSVSQIINYQSEKRRRDMVTLVATYPEHIKDFMNSDPGLRSRFRIVHFPDRPTDHFVKVLERNLSQVSLSIESDTVRSQIWDHFSDIRKRLGKNHVNGRTVREFEDSLRAAVARRLETNGKHLAPRYTVWAQDKIINEPLVILAQDVEKVIRIKGGLASTNTLDVHTEYNPYKTDGINRAPQDPAGSKGAQIVPLTTSKAGRPPEVK